MRDVWSDQKGRREKILGKRFCDKGACNKCPFNFISPATGNYACADWIWAKSFDSLPKPVKKVAMEWFGEDLARLAECSEEKEKLPDMWGM